MSFLDKSNSVHLKKRRRKEFLFCNLCRTMTWLSMIILGTLLFHVTRSGMKWIDLDFLTSFPSRFPEQAGIKSALYGTAWLMFFTALFSISIGIGSALYLEEYAKKNRINTLIEINIANLAGVPSIVYGMLGLIIFVRGLELGRSVLAGSLTMSLLILPVIIIVSRESIKAVPQSLRNASLAIGATKWQTIWHHILPVSLPGIITGVILALSRAIGETAPLIMIGALTYIAFVPEGPMDSFTALPIQIFNWASRPRADFHSLAAAGIMVLLTVLLFMNGLSVWIRHRSQ